MGIDLGWEPNKLVNGIKMGIEWNNMQYLTFVISMMMVEMEKERTFSGNYGIPHCLNKIYFCNHKCFLLIRQFLLNMDLCCSSFTEITNILALRFKLMRHLWAIWIWHNVCEMLRMTFCKNACLICWYLCWDALYHMFSADFYAPLFLEQGYWDHWSSAVADGSPKEASRTTWGMT